MNAHKKIKQMQKMQKREAQAHYLGYLMDQALTYRAPNWAPRSEMEIWAKELADLAQNKGVTVPIFTTEGAARYFQQCLHHPKERPALGLFARDLEKAVKHKYLKDFLSRFRQSEAKDLGYTPIMVIIDFQDLSRAEIQYNPEMPMTISYAHKGYRELEDLLPKLIKSGDLASILHFGATMPEFYLHPESQMTYKDLVNTLYTIYYLNEAQA